MHNRIRLKYMDIELQDRDIRSLCFIHAKKRSTWPDHWGKWRGDKKKSPLSSEAFLIQPQSIEKGIISHKARVNEYQTLWERSSVAGGLPSSQSRLAGSITLHCSKSLLFLNTRISTLPAGIAPSASFDGNTVIMTKTTIFLSFRLILPTSHVCHNCNWKYKLSTVWGI